MPEPLTPDCATFGLGQARMRYKFSTVTKNLTAFAGAAVTDGPCGILCRRQPNWIDAASIAKSQVINGQKVAQSAVYCIQRPPKPAVSELMERH